MIPEHEWLPQAQRLAVGMRMRVLHGRERRPNMTVGNDRTHWWAYCQRCKQGGVLQKEHVLLTAPAPAGPQQLRLPEDAVLAEQSEFGHSVGVFLARKGMAYPYLPQVYVSPTARRLLLQDYGGYWHGRDLTDRAPSKWLNYAGVPVVAPVIPQGCTVVLCEDLFSMFKMQHALGPDVPCVCTLGTSIAPVGISRVLPAQRVLWAYDGDDAGEQGYRRDSPRIRALGARVARFPVPQGLDPKDMTIGAIRAAFQEVTA